MPRAARRLATLLALGFSFAFTASGSAAPVAGFVEDWTGTSVHGWGGALHITYSNPGTGGIQGVGDGYLNVLLPGTTNFFGARSFGTEYNGDWTAAGIQFVRLALKDVGTDDDLEVHFALGTVDNFWQYNSAFIPSTTDWGQFVVDLRDSNAFTQIIDSGGLGYAWAIAHATVVLVRHDLAPYEQEPNAFSGDLGIDRLELLNTVVGIGDAVRSVPAAPTLRPPYPNPSRGPVTFGIEGVDAMAVTMEIVDVQGRLVRRASLPPGQSGLRTWLWDGRDQDGRRVPAGSYRVRAITAAGGVSRALVRLGN